MGLQQTALRQVMGSGDEAQLRDAIQAVRKSRVQSACRVVLRSEAARDVELPLSQLEKAEKALTEMVRPERELQQRLELWFLRLLLRFKSESSRCCEAPQSETMRPSSGMRLKRWPRWSLPACACLRW